MAASGFTPIQLYRSATPGAVPTAANLAPGELALNTADQKLFFENASGVVVSIDTANGTVTSVNASGGTTGLTFSGGPITTSGTLTLSGTLAVANGGTGATTLTGVVKGNGTSAFTAGTVSLTSEVSGTLPVANGGTGVTSSTGTTSVVLSNSPVLVTPTLGAASATSIANGLGAVGTPSYTFTGDLNTGMWSPGTDTVAFSTNGAERARIDSSGKVGIGTSAPLQLLQVHGSSGSDVYMRVSNTDSGTGSGLLMGLDGNEAGVIRLETNQPLSFGTSNTERMRIDNAGNVGIGTTSPADRLNVSDGTANIQLKPIGGSSIGYVGLRSNHALGFTTNDTERMRIDSSGNVGIGETSPGAKLHVSGGVVGTTAGNLVNVTIDQGGAGSNAVGIRTNLVRVSSGTDWTTTAMRLQGRVDATNFGYIDLVSGGAQGIAFGSDTSERMRIDASGNVGIGTTSPGAKLDVLGISLARTDASGGNSPLVAKNDNTGNNTTKTTGLLFQGVDTVGTGKSTGLVQCGPADANYVASYLAFQTRTADALSERMRITSAGNVGIGTSSPVTKLEVKGSGFVAASISGDSTSETQLRFNTNTSARISQQANQSLIFDTNATERMRITAAGDVGIGTTPSFKLQVDAASGANQVAYFVNTSAGSTLAGIAASIESGGNNTNSYHFAGVTQTVALWYLYGNGTTSYTSDIRVKKNVTTTRDGYLEDVCKLRVVKYNWYNDSDDTPRELGFIAQEVEQVFPGLVQDALHPTKDGEIHKVLKGSVMMPIMLKALQEASAKIDALTARVAQLEGK